MTLEGDVTLKTTSRTLYLGGASTNANTISGIIGQAGEEVLPVTKQGVGTWVLSSADNNYKGATTVSQGKLVIDGNISTSVTTTVKDTATLGGTGTVGALTVEGGGTLAPGNSANPVGTLTVTGNLGFSATSVLAFEFNPFDPTGANDLVDGVTDLTLDGLLNVTATTGSFAGLTSGSWRLFNYSGILTDSGLTVNPVPGALADGYSWGIDTATPSRSTSPSSPSPAPPCSAASPCSPCCAAAAPDPGRGLFCLWREAKPRAESGYWVSRLRPHFF